MNGVKVVEPYAVHKTEYVDAYRDNFPSEPNVRLYESGREMRANHIQNGEVVVPRESFFVLGDNRDASFDSRYWGFVPRTLLIGRPWVVYWSSAAPNEALFASP